MRIRVPNAIDSRPGCDFPRGNRSFGLSLFVLGVSIGLLNSSWSPAQSLSPPVRSQPFVGSVVSELFVLKDVTKPLSEKSIVVTPAVAALVHVSQPMLPEGVIKVSTLFRRPGRVSIRFPAGTFQADRDVGRSQVKTYDVRPWPRAMMAEADGGVIRAGVGSLSAALAAQESIATVGSSVRIDLTLIGPAAMAVENVPEIRIRAVENSTPRDARFRPMLVDDKVDWGDGDRKLPQRTWSFEWHAVAPGAFRVEPVRIVHLDDAGTIQTRLVSGPDVRIRTRALFRVAETGGTRQSQVVDRIAHLGRNQVAIIGLLASFIFSFVLAVGIRRLWGSHWFVRWRLEHALSHEMTQRQALARWRALEPQLRTFRSGVDPGLDRACQELTRRAFGRETQKPSSVAFGAAEEG